MRRGKLSDIWPCLLLGLACVTLALTGCDDDDDDQDVVSDDVGSNNVTVVVCLGDSITAADGLVAYPGTFGEITGKTAINAGVGGDRAADGVARVGGASDGSLPRLSHHPSR